VHSMKAHAGEKRNSAILNPWRQTEVRDQLRASAAVSLGKEPPVPFEHEAE
jgi:hypothetical protein